MLKRLSGVLVLFGLLTAVWAGPAYARRTVPTGFFGVVAPPLMDGLSSSALDRQMGLMASSGVETVRLSFSWAQLESARGAFDFSALDRLVTATASHHLQAMINVAYTPSWNSSNPTASEPGRYPPKDINAYADLMRRLVLRYGPHGTLFSQNPRLPRSGAVRSWQVWNEQDALFYWDAPKWWVGYTKLLKLAYPAIHRLDHGATVIAGSLVASTYSESPWVALGQLYRAGAKKYFDAVSVHPFTDTAKSVGLSMNHLLTIVQRMRAQMLHYGDRRKGLMLTEMTWSAASGKVPRGALLGFETTPRGQAQRLASAYATLASQRRKLGVTQVYWSTWATQYDATGDLSDMIFRFTGLIRYNGFFTALPLLSTYANTAARYEGCRKSTVARCR